MAYAFKVTLTIDHTKCGASDSSNFPVLISLTDARLKTVANGGAIQNTGAQVGGNPVTIPFDLVFTSDSGGTTTIPWEIDFYDGTAGTVWAWAKLASVSHTVDTVFYAWFGNAVVNTQQNTGSFSVANAWDASYALVQHLPNGSTLTGKDSTSNANNSSAITATAVAGQIDGGAAFNGTTQAVTIPSSASLNFTGAFTLEAWFYETDNSNYRTITSKGANFGRSMSVFLASGALSSVFYDNVGVLVLSQSWALSTWNYLVLSDDGTNINVYLNGASVFASTGGVGASGNTATLNIGYAAADGNFPMAGRVDEVRISNAIRSADWITTEYNNQSSPSTFMSVSISAPAVASAAPSLTLTGCGC